MIPKNWRYSRGDIYYANMEPHVGSEQGGERPVVVLQNDTGNKHSPTLIIATLTSRVDKKLSLPTHVLLDQNPGLRVPSIVQLPSTSAACSGLPVRPAARKWTELKRR